MEYQSHCTVEFVGGPYDGHTERFPMAEETLPQDLIWVVSNNVFRVLHGKPPGAKQPVTSVAVYEKANTDGMPRYRFVGAVSPGQLSMVSGQSDLHFGEWFR